ncbi:septal ring lytic transglycosylase RlpA family protein [Rubrobacter xylanophilus]|uniref:septal ring lytic transglycosylase RlpA family protein n=1 Tax=Rubrobacter xylanophilus TaxID=49319 RepID=UPI001F24692B|nr:septal ring lytic transglycosylase RlpA family protein [Rubrobacter xylanophilus]
MLALLVAGGVALAQQMTATWYGPGFEGSTTASGEPFDPSDYTAAHKTLPFGTKLIVTYNGRSVVVRVNDRGPYSGGHDLDLSQAAAEYLGLTAVGSAVVNVEFADPSTPTGPYGGGQQPAPAQQEEPAAAQQSGQESRVPEASGGQNGGASPVQKAATEQYAEEQPAAPEQYEEERPAADPGQRAGRAAASGQYDGEESSPEPVSGLNLKGALQGIAEDPGAARNWIELAEAAAPVRAGQPEQAAGAEKTDVAGASGGGDPSTASSAPGISVLPDTGGASAAILAGIGALVLAGLVVGHRVFRR